MRLRELECLTGLSAMDTSAPLIDWLAEAAKIVRAAFRHPQQTGIRISWKGECLVSECFNASADSVAGTYGELAVEASCRENTACRPSLFSPEEQHLLQSVANLLEGRIRAIETISEMEATTRVQHDIFRLSPLPSFIYDLETLAFLEVNEAAMRHYGFTREEFMSMTLRDIRPPEDIPLLEEALKRSKNVSHLYFEGKFRHRKKNGEIILVDIQSNILEYQGRRAEIALATDITARVEAQRKAEALSEQYRLLDHAASEAMFDWDIINDKAQWSNGMTRVLGILPEQLMSKESTVAIIHKSDLEDWLRSLDVAVNDPRADFWEHSYRMYNSEGHLLHVKGSGAIMRDAQSQAVRMVGTLRDRTEEVRLHELLDLATNLARIGGWEANLVQGTMYWSPMTRRIYDVEDDLQPSLELNISFIDDPDAVRSFGQYMSDLAYGSADNFDMTCQIRTAKGNIRYVRVIGEAVRENERLIAIKGSVQDMTDETLRQQELELYEQMVAQTSDGIVVTDVVGPRIVFVNDAYCAMTGYSREEVIGQTPRILQGPETDRKELDKLRNCLKQGVPFKGEVINYRKNGEKFWTSLHISPMRDDQGNIVRWIAMKRDTTRRRNNEMNLRKYADEMEELVQARTLALADAHEEMTAQFQDINASIAYAQRIQLAVLSDELKMRKILSQSFAITMPRDKVSGDFIFTTEVSGSVIVAVVDCTGHGVPGAFMSLMGHQILDSIVNVKQVTSPASILRHTHVLLNRLLRQGKGEQVRDGMELAIVRLDKASGKVMFAGANRPLFLADATGVTEIPGTKRAIGGDPRGQIESDFSETALTVGPGTLIYLTTDGYYDQIGGIEDRRMMRTGFRELLMSISTIGDMDGQRNALIHGFEQWRNGNNQVDDVAVIGIRL